MVDVLVLDLDDTIYLEREYVRSGFCAVAAYLEARSTVSADSIFEYLWSGFLGGVRGTAFNDLIARYPELARTATIEELIDVFRQHSPDIHLAEPTQFTGLLEHSFELALISDGFARSQYAKLQALDIESSFSSVILTDVWGREYWKPNHRAFKATEERYGKNGRALAYVADNPRKDFIAPNQRGWLTVRLRMPGQIHEAYEPDRRDAAAQHEIKSLADLKELL